MGCAKVGAIYDGKLKKNSVEVSVISVDIKRKTQRSLQATVALADNMQLNVRQLYKHLHEVTSL